LKNISSRPINATELNLVNKSVPIQENLTTKNLSGKEKKILHKLGIVLDFRTKMITIGEILLPMRNIDNLSDITKIEKACYRVKKRIL
jgi:hypothetical protein